MTAPVVVASHGVTVIGGGAVGVDDLALAEAVAPTIVAADGGADRCRELGREPDWIIGDLDSVSDAARQAIAPDRVIHIAEQDSTDFTKCLTRIDAPFAIAVGFAGLRLDHTLAALTAMSQIKRPATVMLASDDIVFLAPSRLTLGVPAGTRVSLYPLGEASGRSTGLEWPIDGIAFTPDGRIGTSNRATGPVELQIEGKMLVMLPRQQLDLALSALGFDPA